MAGWRLDWPLTRRRQQWTRSGTAHRHTEPSTSNAKHDSAHKEPLEPMSSLKETNMNWIHEVQTLPAYDKGLMTRNTCIGGLIFSWLVSIACVTLAHWTFQSGQLFRTQNGGYTHNGQGERVFFLSTLFLSSTSAEKKGFVLNGIAISALGIGILGQAMISTLCLWGSRKLIPTWSSNPLNTALTCLHHGMRSVDGRCMLSVHQTDWASMPEKPLPTQASARRAMPSIRHITRFLWAFVALVIVWGIAVGSNPYFRKTSSTTLPLYGESVPVLELNLCALLITTSLQIFLTLSLHLTELLVNLSRDEHIWRLATSKTGTQRSFGPVGSLKTAISSWQTVLLFTLKSLAYWLFGLAVNSDGQSVYMNWVGILLLLAGVGVVAAFGSFLAWSQRSGSQPATFGHLQTLVNLMDDWFEEGENVWWGDKGVAKNTTVGGHGMVRHAGTSNVCLQGVKMDALYQ
ncbi:hypothetical protein HO133_002849 [Letharia lupina]|uniref:Uncharacterized protein n=1 Tax=Letharia lupina TaxID=560253 RepID=A0A8H6F9N2_9LECA|nr:uncharacterized protein HO133_002849 [Letharia lupina]KAF6220417.1 hypothetical protein HO133_002849 [Letharia lupina]